jgi:Protein of unknown function (DUF3486)
MNPPLNPMPLPESPVPSPVETAATTPSPNPPIGEPDIPSRRKGKIAQLPKEIRDKINVMMQNGESYPAIIEYFRPSGLILLPKNLSNWFVGGHQDWLREQRSVDENRRRREFATDLFSEKDGPQIHQATLQVAATNLCQLLVDLDPVAMRETLEDNPDKYTRLLNAIARLSDGAIKCDRHRTDEAERHAKIEKINAPAQKRGISDESLKAAEDKLNLL